MKKGIVPCPGIDTDTRWGYSHTNGWIFGYKLYLICTKAASASGGEEEQLVVLLTADITTANVPDNKMYVPLTFSSLVLSLSPLRYMVVDPTGYDDKELYEYSKKILG